MVVNCPKQKQTIMKKTILCLSIAMVTSLFISCTKEETLETTETLEKNSNYERYGFQETVVVANRGSSSISFIDVRSNAVTETVTIPNSEPMYVVYVQRRNKLYVGDRRNSKVHVVNPSTKEIESSISVGNGVFHMWADGFGKQLWVNSDIDNTISVIDLHSNTVSETIPLSIKPHDVFLSKNGRKAYVSVINSNPALADSIYSFSTTNYTKTNSRAVGKDPHLFHIAALNRLYVPCQSGELFTLNGNNLDVISTLSLPGAHGIFSSINPSNLFVTNISGAELYGLKTIGNSSINTVSTPVATPHNVVVNVSGTKMFVTHSGASADKVTVYKLQGNTIVYDSTLTVGTNPFGIAYYFGVR